MVIGLSDAQLVPKADTTGPSVPSSWSNSNAGTAFFISPDQRRSYPNPPPDGKLARNLTEPYRELFRHPQIWERQAAIACRGRAVYFIPAYSIPAGAHKRTKNQSLAPASVMRWTASRIWHVSAT